MPSKGIDFHPKNADSGEGRCSLGVISRISIILRVSKADDGSRQPAEFTKESSRFIRSNKNFTFHFVERKGFDFMIC